MVDKLLTQADIKGATVQTLRHTFAIRQALNDAGMRAAAARLGAAIRVEPDGVCAAVKLIEGFSPVIWCLLASYLWNLAPAAARPRGQMYINPESLPHRRINPAG